LPIALRIAALVKQIPQFEAMELTEDGRLRRDGIELEMNPYCRRAVAKACELAMERPGSEVVVFTLGPLPADDTLREAIAWGLDRGVDITGVHVTDPAFAGSDTLATAKALAAALRSERRFDLVLAGRNSVDADTGQVGPELAELLDLPFLTGVRELALDDDRVDARCELDDGWSEASLRLPAILSTAERLTEPSKVDPPGRAAVPAERIRRIAAADLGPGPWGQEGSPTWVGPVKVMAVDRARRFAPDAPLADQLRAAMAFLAERGALDHTPTEAGGPGSTVRDPNPYAPRVAVVLEPDRMHSNRELLGAAAALTGNVLAITLEPADAALLSSYGADAVVQLDGPNVEEDVAAALADVARRHHPWAILLPSTAWGREVGSRAAVQLDAGLVGDAVDLDIEGDRLFAWKPAFGGQLVAAIGCSSPIQMATVRPGVLPMRKPRAHGGIEVEHVALSTRGRVDIRSRTRDDDLDVLAEAHTVIGVGTGVRPDEYGSLEPLCTLLGAELGATRKVTDKGWMTRARQIGITGRSIAPRLFISIGASGKFNHAVGVRAAGTVLAINPDPDAPIWDHADIGIVADWHDALPLLVAELRERERERS
jgi:electron transfer flavoprotein alpha subunit/electron transfer flavoprotein alpha/beta subunit